MGILPDLRKAHADVRRITFVDTDGSPIAAIRPEAVSGGVEGRDLEVRRGDLAEVLHGAVSDDVEFVFGDSIATLHDHDGGVDVTFRGGGRRTFDLVVGADGLHSHTRGLVFGPEEPFHRYLDQCFAGFTMPNHLGLAHEGLTWNAPGKTAVLYAPGDGDRLHAFLSFLRLDPPLDAFRDPRPSATSSPRSSPARDGRSPAWWRPCAPATTSSSTSSARSTCPAGPWAASPWWVTPPTPRRSSPARAPASPWWAPTSSPASRPPPPATRRPSAAYERTARDFVELNQALALKGSAAISPRTEEALLRRNRALRDPAHLPGVDGRAASSALPLPDYAKIL
ncbi:hypothetical protein [Streptosporangium vulgare]|uniref:hypothetical protein n=1 Tax=Streptosporangium vulgare TaxID=46190 RepID=UPI0031DC5A56